MLSILGKWYEIPHTDYVKNCPQYIGTDNKFSLSLQRPVPRQFLFIKASSGKCILYKKYVISCETAAVAEWTWLRICGHWIISEWYCHYNKSTCVCACVCV